VESGALKPTRRPNGAEPGFLTLDLGNSSLRALAWRSSDSGDACCTARWEGGGTLAALPAFDLWLETAVGELEVAVVSAVGLREVESALLERLLPRVARLVDRSGTGLVLALGSPETVGADRLFAARGACEEARSSALVVDAGTALTVDAVRWTERGVPIFLGGAIAPGPSLLVRSLEQGTARLPAVEPHPGVCALGRDTRAAIEAGVVVGFEGAASRLVERVSAESGIVGPLFLTGGARAFLAGVLPGAIVVPDLIHLGMLAACGLRARMQGQPERP
jgi:type III pantothenate kinase